MRDESEQLLRQYAAERSEAAFRKLVRQHSGLVYGTALRKLGGDRAAAEDVMQEVFTLLVRKAASLEGVVLAGWLYRQTCRQSANHIRSESRRRKRELVAVQAMDSYNPDGAEHSAVSTSEMGEEIDRALLTLPVADRDALVLRFFNNHDYKRVGASQNITEAAARKRVSRALEKLAAILRKNGITAGSSISLGGTMSGMGAVSVPSTLIDRVAANALKAAPAGGLAALHPLLKSFLAGLLVTSAAAGTLAASRSHLGAATTTPVASSTATFVKREPLEPVYLKPVPENLTAEQLIIEIKKLQAGPPNVLTQNRMGLLLKAFPIDQIAEFFALAGDRLNLAEKQSCYSSLLQRWMKTDPDAAITCIFDNHMEKAVEPGASSPFLLGVYGGWMKTDVDNAQKWLLRTWSDRNLKQQSIDFRMNQQQFMATQTVDYLIGKGREDEALQFAIAIPDPESVSQVLVGALGKSESANAWYQLNQDQALRISRRLYQLLPDTGMNRTIVHCFWRMRETKFPGELERLKSELSPAENFDMELILLETGRQEKGRIGADIDRALESGLACGLPYRQVTQQIGESLVASQGQQMAALRFIDEHRDALRLDEALKAKVAEQDDIYLVVRGEPYPHGWESLLWASRISEPEERLLLSRGTFRKMLTEASGEQIHHVLDHPDLPADLAENFRTLLQESR